MNWSRVAEIARWEYLQKVKSKAFILTLFLLPVVIGGFVTIPSLIISQEPDSSEYIGIVDRVGDYAPEFASRIRDAATLDNGEPAWLPKVYDEGAPQDSVDAQLDALAEELEGYVLIARNGDRIEYTYYSTNPNNFRAVSAVDNSLEDVVLARELTVAGIDTASWASVDRAVQAVDVEARKIDESGDSSSDFLSTFWSGYAGIMLFMILILTTGQSLVRGLVEEKSNRIMEMLVGSGSPTELMWGKLIGLTGLGLTQVGAWILLGGVVILALPGAMGAGFALDAALFAPLPYVLLYLVLGYFFYAAIFIGVGSLVTTEQEAQMITQYLTFLLVAPIAFALGVMADPNAGWVQSLSYIPLLTPTMMMLRVVVKMPSTETILATIALMLASTTLVIWAAGRIFRTAILLYGKRPSVREVFRWLKS